MEGATEESEVNVQGARVCTLKSTAFPINLFRAARPPKSDSEFVSLEVLNVEFLFELYPFWNRLTLSCVCFAQPPSEP